MSYTATPLFSSGQTTPLQSSNKLLQILFKRSEIAFISYECKGLSPLPHRADGETPKQASEILVIKDER